MQKSGTEQQRSKEEQAAIMRAKQEQGTLHHHLPFPSLLASFLTIFTVNPSPFYADFNELPPIRSTEHIISIKYHNLD